MIDLPNFSILLGALIIFYVFFFYLASCGHFTPGHNIYLILKARIS